jgi:hypothetical protein
LNIEAVSSYQERWRDVPDEARQPSIFIEMVPIHTKRLLWEMGERFIFDNAFLPAQKGIFIFLK